MRISDWSSDVCSSDLLAQHFTMQTAFLDQRAEGADRHTKVADIGIGGVVAAKRDAYTPKYRERTPGPHAFAPCSSSSGGEPQSATRRIDRTRAVEGQRVSVRGVTGGRRNNKKKINHN